MGRATATGHDHFRLVRPMDFTGMRIHFPAADVGDLLCPLEYVAVVGELGIGVADIVLHGVVCAHHLVEFIADVHPVRCTLELQQALRIARVELVGMIGDAS